MIRMLKKGNMITLTEIELENFMANKGAKICDNYNILVWVYYLYALPEEAVA